MSKVTHAIAAALALGGGVGVSTYVPAVHHMGESPVAISQPVAVTDSINSIVHNADGSVDANVTFENGKEMLGNTNIHLPAPEPLFAMQEKKGKEVRVKISDGVPYTEEQAAAMVTEMASAKKKAWLASYDKSRIISATQF